MKKINDDTLRGVLKNAHPNSNGSHYIADCPFCEKDQHFYIRRETDKINGRGENISYYWECKKCGENGKIYKLFRKLDKLHLLEFGESIGDINRLEKINLRASERLDVDIDLPKAHPPIGFNRIDSDEYLDSRGFTESQYEKYKVGRSWLSTFKDFVIFLIEEDGECKGYVSRRKKGGAWFKEQEERVKLYGGKKPLRYNNSQTDFAKLIYGIDEIDGLVDTMVIVEGIFDKFNVERILGMDQEGSFWKCGATFGKKINDIQMNKLKKKGIKNVILMYDPDALNDSKRYSYELTKHFKVKVGYLDQKDPGDLLEDELYSVMDNLYDPLNFFLDKIEIKKL